MVVALRTLRVKYVPVTPAEESRLRREAMELQIRSILATRNGARDPAGIRRFAAEGDSPGNLRETP